MATPRVTIDALPEQTVPEDTNLLVIQDSGVTKKMCSSRCWQPKLSSMRSLARVTALETP